MEKLRSSMAKHFFKDILPAHSNERGQKKLKLKL